MVGFRVKRWRILPAIDRPPARSNCEVDVLRCRREFKRGFLREFKRGQSLERVFSEDFGPVVEGRTWWLGDRPELSERMMNQGD